MKGWELKPPREKEDCIYTSIYTVRAHIRTGSQSKGLCDYVKFETDRILKIVTCRAAVLSDCCQVRNQSSIFSTVQPGNGLLLELQALILPARSYANFCTQECAQLMLPHNVVYPIEITGTHNIWFCCTRNEPSLHTRVQHELDVASFLESKNPDQSVAV